MKTGHHINLEQLTVANTNYRQVLYTAVHCQLVLMSLGPGEEIGLEVHPDGDQFFRFEKGQGKVVVDESTYEVSGGHSIIVPAGCQHNVVNTSTTESLKLYTIYTPPHHLDGLVRTTKAEAETSGVDFDGHTTE